MDSCKVLNNKNILKLKRHSEFSKMNRIRLELFSFAQNEINEKKKLVNDKNFSFSNKLMEEKKENQNQKEIHREPLKNKIIKNNKISNDSSDITDEEENSSDISCEEEDI